MPQTTSKALLRGIVKVMRKEGIAPTRTRIIKFLYLADLHYARSHDGKTVTEWGWYVGPFGPIAREALALLDDGVREGWLRSSESAEDEVDEDTSRRTAIFYDLADDFDAELPTGFVKLMDWIKQYGDATNRLLRFVYGNTEPMLVAAPGDELDFGTAMRRAQERPVVTRLSAKDRKKAKALIKSIASSVVEPPPVEEPEGLYDDAYRDGVPKEEALPAKGDFVLEFD